MTQTFSTLGVAEPLLRALSTENYLSPTPIQTQAIPLILSGRDVLGLAQTGTGKTAAFGLPLLQKLAETGAQAGPRAVRALILAPTRELAVQIDESLKTYGRHLRLRHAVVLGGVNQNKQVAALRHGVDVLVATPGRLLDLVNQKHVVLGAVGLLVIDEADRMFDMGFIRDVRRIVSYLPKKRQSLLFSATMPDEVAHLVQEILHQPARIAITPKAVTAEKIEQRVYFVEQQAKRGLLHELLRDPQMKRVIVFTRTKHGANKVADQIGKAGHAADAIHGNKSQGARQRALENFRSGRSRVLVATDIAARGIDIDDVTHVVNFELPNVAESYVHRIGRTARAGTGGIAISLCDSSERALLRDIEKLIRQPLIAMNDANAAPEPAPVKREIDYAKRRPRHRRRRSNHAGRAQRAA
ncbi:MAG TPA: DEAD/DEAH box helicase [Rhizomicrobium sp.]|nr:DEAD/DEAH box helicase [Rhizomicrobium sp.]